MTACSVGCALTMFHTSSTARPLSTSATSAMRGASVVLAGAIAS